MFRRILFLLLGLGALLPVRAFTQTRARSSREASDSIAIAALTRSITRGASSESGRAAAIYQWIARNLTYDVAGYYAGRITDVSPEQVYRTRLAVCGGFVKLYERMAHEVGLTVTPILGYAKGFDYRRGKSTRKPNHSWLAVSINDRWRLVDPTWAAGVVNNGRFERNFTWDYFLIDPEVGILSHYPKDDEWQLLTRTVSRSDFERIPIVPPVVVNAGFTPMAIRFAATSSDLRDFPLIGVRDRDRARVVSAPVTGTLKRGSRVAVDIVWPEASDVALVSGSKWTHLRREGDHFRGEAPAFDTTLQVVGRPRTNRSFETLLQYAVE